VRVEGGAKAGGGVEGVEEFCLGGGLLAKVFMRMG
jgi:hypothetical protein